MNKAVFKGLFLLILLAALLFRLVSLDIRPMHHDEANQAVKFGNLLERGEYRYDRSDHHGPSLYYLTLPAAWCLSKTSLASLNENDLRMVPALFGIFALFLLLALKTELGNKSLLLSALFLAFSPVVVYYNRFYIQESLFVFFVLGLLISTWKYWIHPSLRWALASGFFAGMMYATKETCLIVFAGILGALIITRLTLRKQESSFSPSFRLQLGHTAAGLSVALLISLLFYSSFFRNIDGFSDSLLSFTDYFQRAGAPGWHSQPLFFYVKMLAFSRFGHGPIWSEALILILAAAGGFAAFRNRSQDQLSHMFLRFALFFTILTTFIFSLIPYKTPWNLLPFYIGLVLLAGKGAVFLFDTVRRKALRIVVLLLLLFGLFHLGVQSFQANFRMYADPQNPYVYAQTSPDFRHLIQRVHDLASIHPEGDRMLIKVIADPYETWPLPWSLRRYKQVGYWQDAEQAGEVKGVPVIISSLDKLGALEPRLGKGFQTEFFGLRPEVVLAIHVRLDIWERFIDSGK